MLILPFASIVWTTRPRNIGGIALPVAGGCLFGTSCHLFPPLYPFNPLDAPWQQKIELFDARTAFFSGVAR
jgi:hypothetical protein